METKLEQLFKSFCSSDTSLLDHLAFQKPFIQNGNVWATDKKVALCLSKAHCDFDADIDYINIGYDMNELLHPPNTQRVLIIDKSDFDKFKTEDELIIFPAVPCRACKGHRNVVWKFEFNGWEYKQEFECPSCEGSGNFLDEKKEPTGNKTFGNADVKLGGVYFNMNRFYKLIEVQEVMGGEIILTYADEKNGARQFQIGKATVLLMPNFLDAFAPTNNNNILEIK